MKFEEGDQFYIIFIGMPLVALFIICYFIGWCDGTDFTMKSGQGRPCTLGYGQELSGIRFKAWKRPG